MHVYIYVCTREIDVQIYCVALIYFSETLHDYNRLLNANNLFQLSLTPRLAETSLQGKIIMFIPISYPSSLRLAQCLQEGKA